MEPQPATSRATPSCPQCGGKLRLRPDQMGTQVICPKCKASFVVGAKPPPPNASRSSDGAIVEDDEAYQPEIPLVRSPLANDPPPPKPKANVQDVKNKNARVKDAKIKDIVIPEQPKYSDDEAYEPERPLRPSVLGGESRYVEVKYLGPTSNPPDDDDTLEREMPQLPVSRAADDYFALAAAKGLIGGEVVVDPPPKWTFFSRVFGYPWRGANLTRFTIMAVGMVLDGELLFMMISMLTGEGTVPPLMRPFVLVFGSVLTLLVMSFSAACFIPAVEDTANGHDLIQEDSLPPAGDWFMALVGIINICMMSGVLGLPLVAIEAVGPIAVPIAILLMFPILLLSALEADSFLAPISGPVWKSLARYWWAWLTFYVLTTLLVGGWLFATLWALANQFLGTWLLAGPALAAVVLIYARLLGRLGWLITEPVDEEAPATSKRPAARTSKRKKRKLAARNLPPDLDSAATFLAGSGKKK